MDFALARGYRVLLTLTNKKQGGMSQSNEEPKAVEERADMIQPHGCVCICDLQLSAFTHVSQNVEDYFCRPVHEILGQSLDVIFKREFYHALRNAISLQTITAQREYLGEYEFESGILEAACHQRSGYIIIEFQKVQRKLKGVELEIHRLRWLMPKPEQDSPTLEDSFDILVHELRSLTKFDKVIAHRFQDNEPGFIVSESSAPHVKSLKYSEQNTWDIPALTRTIYPEQPMRSVVDAKAKNTPLVAADTNGNPINMNLAALRGPSETQALRLATMEMQSFLAFPIIAQDKLWA